ncbi:MAG: hypothetical protein HC888_07950 [Candidatus Competibacteraceae bacterium]|nr:hypothetical protein [Candidatus Competibacteraceae bacterium]
MQAMQELMDSGKAPKLLILKARQLGALDPDTNVLTADLRWVRIEELCVGDEVVAFDEEKPSGYGNSRKMRNATVLKKWDVEKEAFEITLEDGRTIIATGDHPFLSKRFVSSTDTAWRRVRDDSPHQKFLAEIRVGDVIRSIVDVWLSPEQKTRKQLWDDAWFGGLLDGEGSLRTKTSGGMEICVSQVDGDVLDRAKAYLDSNYYRYRIEADTRKAGETSKFGDKIVYKLVINQTKEILRLLGETRPTRFMGRYPWIGKEFPNGDSWIKVTAIRSLGLRRMVDIQTSTQTFVAEGLCTHNCSTLVEAIMAWLTIFYTNSNCLVVSYDIPHTAYLFSLMQGFFDFLPWWMKPRTSARERKAGMQFNNPDPGMRSLDPGLNSFIMAEPANAVTGTGRGFRFNGFHGSEVGLWKERAQEIIEAQVKNALVDDITTMGILEGTPDGVGTYFNKFWNQMVELGDRAAWRPKYFPFFMEPTRVLAPPNGWRIAEYEERVRDVVKLEWVKCSSPQCGHINERIRLGVDIAGSVCVRCNAAMYAPMILGDNQLCWYEDARINASTKPETLKLFKQEMSVTANQAWQMSGSPIFSDAAIEWVDFNMRTPRIVGFFDRLDNFHGVNWEVGKCVLKVMSGRPSV